MIEVEIQKLTAAIETLTKVVREMARPTLVVTNGTPTNVTTLEEAEKSYRGDNAVREAMQAERFAMMRKIDGAMETVISDAIGRPKPVEDADQQLADLYKAEQAKAKRKAKVTPEETKALVEAAKPVENPVVTDQPLKDKEEIPNSPEPANISIAEALAPLAHLIPDAANISEAELKGLAMEIARTDSSARPIILGILGEHGAKTITHPDPKHYRAVHGKFMSLAHDIAKNGEEV